MLCLLRILRGNPSSKGTDMIKIDLKPFVEKFVKETVVPMLDQVFQELKLPFNVDDKFWKALRENLLRRVEKQMLVEASVQFSLSQDNNVQV